MGQFSVEKPVPPGSALSGNQHRVIAVVERGEMSRRAAARRYQISESVAIKWLERLERDGSREPVGHGGHRASKLMPHREFLEAARAEKSDITLQALCDRLLAERGVKADTSMMSRFFRRILVADVVATACSPGRTRRHVSGLEELSLDHDGDTRAPVLIKLPASDRAVF